VNLPRISTFGAGRGPDGEPDPNPSPGRSSADGSMRILVTGATGYIGGRLIPKLLELGYRVRVLVRDAERIRGRAWAHRVEVFPGDLLAQDALAGLCDGVDRAYYLVHSMGSGRDFAAQDLRAAENFLRVAGSVPLTVYLGGLLPAGPRISPHLRSRAQVGELLRSALPTTEIRAGPIIGSGSAAFEMVRYLTERHPLMVVPKCVSNQVEPIAVRDVLAYLLAALEAPPLGPVEVGGERVSFLRMMSTYAEVRGLRRRVVSIPVVTPGVVAAWAGMVTPIPHRIAGPLLQGMLQPVVADTRRARDHFPGVRPIAYRRAVELALERIDEGMVETRWTGALGSASTRELVDREGMMREVRTHHVRADAERVHAFLLTLGGERGWLVWNGIWWLRGVVDRIVGGPGLRRGRRHPRELFAGEAVDFWRVERIERPGLLRLRAEMKVPGQAWLQWQAIPEGEGTRLVQTAIFCPDGLAGFHYWYLLYPIHAAMFSRLGRALVREIEAEAERADRRRSNVGWFSLGRGIPGTGLGDAAAPASAATSAAAVEGDEPTKG
jgi:uncharacterized protein YbjT (DUF2867 family)